MMNANPVIALFLALGLMILAARTAGALARRFDQPRVLGELLVGVALGPTLLDILHSSGLGLNQAHLEETIHELAELGVLLLMFKIGLEVRLKELLLVGRVALIAGVIGAALPVLFTLPAVLVFGQTWQAGLFAGVALAATSVSISAQVLLEIGMLQTREGSALLATAVVDDVVAILLLSFAAAFTSAGGTVELGALLWILARMLLFIGAALALAWFVLPRLLHWIHGQPHLAHSYGVAAFALILALLFGWAAERFGGVAAITGAFIAGVGLAQTREKVKRQFEDAIANIAYAFLVPIFFVSVGLAVNLRQFPLAGIPLAGLLLLAAVASKLIGVTLGARWGGFAPAPAFRLSVCMISRGEVGLIIAAFGLERGVFPPDQPVFAALFVVILLTTVLTPPLVRYVYRAQPRPGVAG
ncbi:MAG: cation:proton antiporter [Chloroflexi bacterium]|nr:cation:proton antiporter [Chloroflexota bacterium]